MPDKSSSAASRSEPMASSSASFSSTGSAGSSTTPTALPTEEALQILLSPDGYYKYLGITKPEPEVMGPKYQAAMEAGGGGGGNAEGIDLDQVKKNYRRLSLRHHPDRRTGDAETFRMLNRAKVVLSSAKLRREYDLVGLDLEDDAEEEHHEDGNATAPASENDEGNGEDRNAGAAQNDGGKDGNSSKTETVMGHLASVTLAAVLQVVVRTGLMGLVSVVVSRYTILAFLAMGLLALLTTKMYAALKKSLGTSFKPTLATMKDALSPLVIALGIFLMYRGRRIVIELPAPAGNVDSAMAGDSAVDATQNEIQYAEWSWTFLAGETVVMSSFLSNSFENQPTALLLLFSVLSLLMSLWLRGRFWRYATLLGFEGVIALLVVLAFPIMEMILESIVEEKMRKVGEKIRSHDVRMKELLRRKREQSVSVS
mmetsp:Transcript_30493/g.64791  ORF Transcript_30493/g.64791 Transcript_30493/m.64791 type:complete len:427 (-) Transcript_30493:192-1472(-)|eukprot:CAMPEP_0172573538 /NCGR_PEP_ID=MMETSP1067-20121228/136242_1 /TAXON_ID=265564 ORGANISM="Thalassiosira punctigera, Strain Tpunct2005C2" /NCGR_SAMPLE_ID=MMETSP1067 /ASSEMBLY_ACC=CAM_ASM_000444 /LENGTH=426 /DNA_ID=CAMNT_0013366145 /DNA_START=96 /DNA_END=1376 /DNA_ORIENTATION=+